MSPSDHLSTPPWNKTTLRGVLASPPTNQRHPYRAPLAGALPAACRQWRLCRATAFLHTFFISTSSITALNSCAHPCARSYSTPPFNVEMMPRAEKGLQFPTASPFFPQQPAMSYFAPFYDVIIRYRHTMAVWCARNVVCMCL